MITPLLAAEVPDYVLTTLKALSVVGIAALGGMLLSWGASLVTKSYFAQSMPQGVTWFIRTLGAVACGLVAWLVLFNAGGSGIGGGGGWLPGGGGGYAKHEDNEQKKDDTAPKVEKKDLEKNKPQDKDKSPAGPLVIEILGDRTLKSLANASQLSEDQSKRYRVVGEKELMTREKALELITKRFNGDPPLRVLQIVLNEDSPDESTQHVTWLVKKAGDLRKDGKKLSVDVLVKGS